MIENERDGRQALQTSLGAPVWDSPGYVNGSRRGEGKWRLARSFSQAVTIFA